MNESTPLLQTVKHADIRSNQLYGEAMAQSVGYKLEFFKPLIKEFLPSADFDSTEPCKILDLGSCTSALALALAEELPDYYHFFECDLDQHFLQQGRSRVSNTGYKERIHHLQANVARLPVADISMNAVIHSSFFHEIFSFPVLDQGPFNSKNCHHVIKDIWRVLKPGGYVFGRDYVAKPRNPDEPLILGLNRDDGFNEETNDMSRRIPINELSSHAKVRRFLQEFVPARDCQSVTQIGGERISMPAWLACETLFHLGYSHSEEMWNSEIHEQYGDYSASDLEMVAFTNSFTPIMNYERSHYDIGELTGLQVFDMTGNRVDTRSRFPTNTYLVWQKNSTP